MTKIDIEKRVQLLVDAALVHESRIAELEKEAKALCIIKGENQPAESQTIVIGSPWEVPRVN